MRASTRSATRAAIWQPRSAGFASTRHPRGLCGGEAAISHRPSSGILARLASSPGDAVRRRQLVEAGWAHGSIVHDNTLDVYIARLRRKLAPLPGAPEITTIHGVGYTLHDPSARLGIRTRLLLAVVGALALALIIGVTAFNLILEQRLSASAESLARAQARPNSRRSRSSTATRRSGGPEERAPSGARLGIRRRHDHREATRARCDG